MNVKVFKLMSGEEIIAEQQHSDMLLFKNPAVVLMGNTPQGLQIGLIPFMPYRKDGAYVSFSETALSVMPMDVSPEMYNNYSKMFGSGIIVANQLPPEGSSLKLV